MPARQPPRLLRFASSDFATAEQCSVHADGEVDGGKPGIAVGSGQFGGSGVSRNGIGVVACSERRPSPSDSTHPIRPGAARRVVGRRECVSIACLLQFIGAVEVTAQVSVPGRRHQHAWVPGFVASVGQVDYRAKPESRTPRPSPRSCGGEDGSPRAVPPARPSFASMAWARADRMLSRSTLICLAHTSCSGP